MDILTSKISGLDGTGTGKGRYLTTVTGVEVGVGVLVETTVAGGVTVTR